MLLALTNMYIELYICASLGKESVLIVIMSDCGAISNCCICAVTFLSYCFEGTVNGDGKFYIQGTVHRESNLIFFQQDATYSVYYYSFDLNSITPEVFYNN